MRQADQPALQEIAPACPQLAQGVFEGQAPDGERLLEALVHWDDLARPIPRPECERGLIR
jgi:hypothetical protein